MKVLLIFIKYDIGNVVLFSPVLRYWREIEGDVTLVTTSFAARLIEEYYDAPQIFLLERRGDPGELIQFLLREKGIYDLGIVFSDYPEARSLALLCVREVYLSPLDENTYRPLFNLLALQGAMGWMKKEMDFIPFFAPHIAEKQKIRGRMESLSLLGEKVIGIAPEASHIARFIPESRLHDIFSCIEEMGYKGVIFYHNKGKTREFPFPSIHCKTVGELASAISFCEGIICPDSAVGHLAFATGVPAIVLHQKCMKNCRKWRPPLQGGERKFRVYYPPHFCVDDNAVKDTRRSCPMAKEFSCFSFLGDEFLKVIKDLF